MRHKLNFKLISPLETQVVIETLKTLIRDSSTLKGNVTGNQFSVRVSGAWQAAFFRGRGSLNGRIIKRSDGTLIEGDFNRSYLAISTASLVFAAGIIGTITIIYRDDSGLPLILLIALFSGLTWLILWIPISDRDFIKQQFIRAFHGTEVESSTAA